MEPLESGQIQPLGPSHAIGPPGWRPFFERGIPSLILKRLKCPKADDKSLRCAFPLAPPSTPLSPPCPLVLAPLWPSGSRAVQGPAQFLCCQGLKLPLPPSLPLAPSRPWPLAAPAPGLPDRSSAWPPPTPFAPLPALPRCWPRGRPLTLAGPLQPALRPRQRWELRAPALNPKR